MITMYKTKHKQYTITSFKQLQYYYKGNDVVINLNSCFPKKGNYQKFLNILKELKSHTTNINLCNLASLCYRFNMRYDSQETLDFVQSIVTYIKQEQCFNIVQNNINNFGEIDMRPIKQLVTYDTTHEILFVNSVLLDCLNVLGFVDNQLYDIIDFTKDLQVLIPEDLVEILPIETKHTIGCYNLIKEIIDDSRICNI